MCDQSQVVLIFNVIKHWVSLVWCAYSPNSSLHVMSEELFDSLFNIYVRVELMCVPNSLMHKHQKKKNNFDGSVFIDQP